MNLHTARNEIRDCRDDRPRRQLLWGLALVIFGTLFLLDRLNYFDLTLYLGPQAKWWHFLPLLLALGGLIRLLSANSVRQVAKGLVRIVVGLWLFACLELWAGLTFENSWPVLLVAAGAQMLVRGWYGRGSKSGEEVTP